MGNREPLIPTGEKTMRKLLATLITFLALTGMAHAGSWENLPGSTRATVAVAGMSGVWYAAPAVSGAVSLFVPGIVMYGFIEAIRTHDPATAPYCTKTVQAEDANFYYDTTVAC